MKKNIEKAIKEKKLIPYNDIVRKYSKERKRKIKEEVDYLLVTREIKQLRERLNLTQKELSKRVGVKREYLARLEGGRQNITLRSLYKVASAMGKTVHFKIV